MNLKELRDEIKRLNSLKDNNPYSTIGMKLEVIRQTVEAINESIPMDTWLSEKGMSEYYLWQEIKNLLGG